MSRWILLGLGLVALALGLWWVALHPARLILDAFGYQVEMPLWVAMGALVLVFLPGTYILKGMTWVLHFPTRLREHRAREAQQRRLQSLENLLKARILQIPSLYQQSLESLRDLGEGSVALFAELADRPDAQDPRTVDMSLRALLQDEKWRTPAYLFLARMAWCQGKVHEALSLAEAGSAFDTDSVAFIALRVQALCHLDRAQDVLALLNTLSKSQKNLSHEVANVFGPAIVRYATQLASQGQAVRARDVLEDAYAALPTSTALIDALAPYLLAQGQHRRLRRMAEYAWQQHPEAKHALLYAQAFEGLSPFDRLHKVKELVAHYPHPVESCRALFEQALNDRLFQDAALALQSLRPVIPDTLAAVYEARLEYAQHRDADHALSTLFKHFD